MKSFESDFRTNLGLTVLYFEVLVSSLFIALNSSALKL